MQFRESRGGIRTTRSEIMSDNTRKMAKECVYGVLDAVMTCLIIGYCIAHLLTPADDCDKNRWQRCGMKIATDAKTGKEYLLSPYGGIIERK